MEFDHYDADVPLPTPALGRQRLLAIGTALVVLVGVGLMVGQVAFTETAPGTPQTHVGAAAAGVVIVRPGAKSQRIAAATPVPGGREQAEANSVRYVLPADGSLVDARQLWVQGRVRPDTAVAAARADIGSVSVLGGRIRLEHASSRAGARVARSRATGEVEVGSAATLTIDGRAVPLIANKVVVVAGVGTVTINEQAVVAAAPHGDRQTGPRYRVVGALVHLRLTSAYQDLPAGSQVIVGRTEAGVRQGKVKPVSHPPAASNASSPFVPTVSTGNPISVQPGTPRPGDNTVPRRSTGVRASGGSSAGNLQGYVFPVLGHSGYSDSWGAPRASTGVPHQGTDIFAAEGTPIVAVADGVLDRVGWNAIGGYRFWLYDAYGNAFYNAHLSAFSPLAYDGARVRAGDVIGFVGHTGDAQGTPPHAHFEIHPGNGAATNPFPFLNAWKQGIAVAIDALGLGGTNAQPSLTLLRASDVSANSGLATSILESVPAAATRPVEEENAPQPTDQSLAAAIEGNAIGG